MFQERIVSFFYLKIFIVVIILIIVGSIAYRLTSEINGASFKNNSFSLLIVAKESKIIYVDRGAKSVHFLAVGNIERFVKGKNPLEASFALGIPINAILVDQKPPQNVREFTEPGNEIRLLFGHNAAYKKLNRYDIYQLMSVIRGAHKDDIKEIRIDLFNQEHMKELVGDAFTDSEIRNRDITIQIDNGTTINGLGSILAMILGKEGYNVISVRTARPEISSYIAYEGEVDSYVSSLQGLTGFPIKKGRVSPATDVTIFLGDDIDAMLSP